jgi:RHS repeat-associated protein
VVLNVLSEKGRGKYLDPKSAEELYKESNLFSGCSLKSLAQVTRQEHWPMVGVERPDDVKDFPVPSVVHMKEGHYVGLLGEAAGLLLVYDPMSGLRHFRREVLNAETSGRFLVPVVKAPAGWRELSDEELSSTVGRSGWYGGFLDGPESNCENCERCPAGAAAGNGGAGNGGGSSPNQPGGEGTGQNSPCGGEVCATAGMARWLVTEPNINLWLRDTPIICQPAYGPAVGLDLRYKQRDEFSGSQEDVFGFGPGWNSRWLSCVDNWYYARYGIMNGVTVCLPGGGMLDFTFSGEETVATDYFYNSRLTVVLDEDVPTGFILDFPDGRQYVYEQAWKGRYFYLTRSVDQTGFATHYGYVEVTDGWGLPGLRLDSITDHNNEELYSIQYTSGTWYPHLVSVVTDRFGRTAEMSYVEDAYNTSRLQQIEDAVGLTSVVTYDENGWPDTLVTPYGTTSFDYLDSWNAYGGYRWTSVTEPNDGRQIYVFKTTCDTLWNGDPWLPTEFPSGVLPGNLPEGTLLDNVPYAFNSFHWNQAQSVGIPTVLTQLTTNHMNKARMRHWLWSGGSPDLALSLEIAPSPDSNGSSVGQMTWYDHAGKSEPTYRGTQIQPSLVVRKLPDGSTWYEAYQRNALGQVTSKTSTYGTGNPASTRTSTYSYASNGQDLVEVRGPNNELVATIAYNNRHQKTNEVLWPDSNTSYTNTWSYDAQGRLTSHTTAAGQTVSYTYSGSSGNYSGYLSGISEQPVQRSQSFTWHHGMIRSYTDERGLTVTNFWDALHRLTGSRHPDGTTTTNLYSRSAAYPNGTGSLNILDRTATKDRLGYWTYFDYDPLRRLVAATNANNVVTRYGYCACGPASYITNAWGTAIQQITTHTYDNAGNLTLTTHAGGYNITNWYNAPGQRIVTGDGASYRWFFYNNQGLLNTVSNAYGIEQSTVYDIDDHPWRVTDANGVTITNTYDYLGRLLTRTYPDGGVERFGYSARGLTAYTNQLNKVTRYVYDEAMRKTWETNANNEVLRYTNNAAGDLLSLTDGKNQTTRWNYDEYGRVTNKLDQVSAVILRYKYDPGSRLTNRWSTAKGDTKYKYDPVGNLTNVDYAASTDVKFQYDPLNRVTNMIDAAGTTKYAYTASGQLWTEDGPFSNDTVTNSYNNRLRTALALQQATGVWTNGFGYDAAKRLTNVTSQAGSFAYAFPSGIQHLVSRIALPNGSYITNTYDAVARLTGTWLKNSSHSTLNSHLYGYNPGNQRTQQVFNVGSTYNYTYDAIGQLKIADSATASEDRGYVYDAAWNLNYRTNNTSLNQFKVDTKNQLTNATPVGNQTYDGNGNVISWPNGSYSYDDENRLVSAMYYNSWKTDFIYDGLGRLRSRAEYGWTGSGWYPGGTTTYVYDGMRVIQERVGSSPAVSYTRGSDLSGSLEGAGGIGGLLARSHGYANSNGNWYAHNCYHADGNGNITYLVNSSQTLAASYRYDPYGNTISSSGTLASANVYRFSSKEFHANSGLYYYGYRFYAPNLQRWLNRDPIEEQGGLNLYGFVFSDPVGWVDDFGHGQGQPRSGREFRIIVRGRPVYERIPERYRQPKYTQPQKSTTTCVVIPMTTGSQVEFVKVWDKITRPEHPSPPPPPGRSPLPQTPPIIYIPPPPPPPPAPPATACPVNCVPSITVIGAYPEPPPPEPTPPKIGPAPDFDFPPRRPWPRQSE